MIKDIFEKCDAEFDKHYHDLECGKRFDHKKVLKELMHSCALAACEEMNKNHYCCKYQTIKKEDFCDHCLQTLSNMEKFLSVKE